MLTGNEIKRKGSRMRKHLCLKGAGALVGILAVLGSVSALVFFVLSEIFFVIFLRVRVVFSDDAF